MSLEKAHFCSFYVHKWRRPSTHGQSVEVHSRISCLHRCNHRRATNNKDGSSWGCFNEPLGSEKPKEGEFSNFSDEPFLLYPLLLPCVNCSYTFSFRFSPVPVSCLTADPCSSPSALAADCRVSAPLKCKWRKCRDSCREWVSRKRQASTLWVTEIQLEGCDGTQSLQRWSVTNTSKWRCKWPMA